MAFPVNENIAGVVRYFDDTNMAREFRIGALPNTVHYINALAVVGHALWALGDTAVKRAGETGSG